MKKLLFIMFTLYLSIFLSEGAKCGKDSNVEESQAFAFGVKKINDYLYIGKKEPGLYFVMERVDSAVPDSRLPFWQKYVQDEYSNYYEYERKCENGSIPKGRGFLIMQKNNRSYTVGLQSFKRSVEGYHSNNELWIAYTSTKEIKKASDTSPDDIEMAVTVRTNHEAPMTTHIGVNRSFHYLLKALKADQIRKYAKEYGAASLREFGETLPAEDEFKLHSHLAMDLHSFPAKVMRIKDPKKIYMITSPVPVMRDIMLKALPHHTYVGDSLESAKQLYKKLQDSDEPLQSKFILHKKEKLQEEIALLNENIWEMNERTADNDELKTQIENLEKKREEKDKESHTLSKTYAIQQNKEIQEIVAKLEMTQEGSPIKKTLFPPKLQIFDKDRKHIIFDHDEDSQTIRVNNQMLTGDETKRYNWFYYGDMQLNPYATIDLDALSTYITLMDPDILSEKERIAARNKQWKQIENLENQFVKTPRDSRLFLYLLENRGIEFTNEFKEAVKEEEIKGSEGKWIKIASYFNRCNTLRDIIEITKVRIGSLNLDKKELSNLLLEFYRPDDEEAAQTLIKMGAAVDAQNYSRETALYSASRIPERSDGKENSLKMVKLLLAHKADPNAATHIGQTPLHHAAEYGNKEIAALLIQNGAKVNVQDTFQGYSPLHYAAQNRHLDTVKLLLKHGADISIKGYNGTPMDVAGNNEIREIFGQHQKRELTL